MILVILNPLNSPHSICHLTHQLTEYRIGQVEASEDPATMMPLFRQIAVARRLREFNDFMIYHATLHDLV